MYVLHDFNEIICMPVCLSSASTHNGDFLGFAPAHRVQFNQYNQFSGHTSVSVITLKLYIYTEPLIFSTMDITD